MRKKRAGTSRPPKERMIPLEDIPLVCTGKIDRRASGRNTGIREGLGRA
jgi:hypothetical protein